MKYLKALSCLLVCAIALTVSSAAAQMQVTKDTVPGVVNFARVETTVACAGAT
jgi:hypothetical protein